MADDLNDSPAPIAPDAETPAASSAAQGARVAELIAAQRAPKSDVRGFTVVSEEATNRSMPITAPRGPGRPRKDGTTPAATIGAKRKKPSGKKPTRAELAAKIKELQAGRGGAVDGAAPAAGAAPGAAPLEPSGLARPEVKARFAAGVSSLATQGGKFLAARRGPHWKMEKLEADALGESAADAVVCIEELAPSLGPYIGKAVQLAPLAIFAGVLFGILIERLEKDAEHEAVRARGGLVPEGERIAVVESHQLTVSR